MNVFVPPDAYPSLKNWYKAQEGDRIVLVEMLDDPCPIEPGTLGTVVEVHQNLSHQNLSQLYVEWDNGSTLMLVPPDQFNIITEYEITEEP